MSLGYAILSLLERGEASGYELMKQFDHTVAAFWHATHPQIYRELRQLESQKLVSHRLVVQKHRPNKKIFRITVAGKTELKRWLEEPSPVAPQVNDVSTLKAFSSYLLEPQRAMSKIRELKSIHRSIHEKWKTLEQQIREVATSKYGADLGLYLSLLRGLTYEESYVRWCEMVEEAIQQATVKAASRSPVRKRATG